MPDGGLYQLLIHLPAPTEIHVGALGVIRFEAGWYVYTGSMRRGLSHRLRRHYAKCKPLRWHIDYLTLAAEVTAHRTRAAGEECALHRATAAASGVTEPVKGFGSSDCRCRSHLCYLGSDAAAWESAHSAIEAGD
ncbi:MAG: GIY-YIG nuclease family protein [Armatimonadetes bacterium]|nr:GIY-YIG nuclease family protein [Armatimonadota bacterium]